jgi:DNA-binding PadR family transcriptional regulator
VDVQSIILGFLMRGSKTGYELKQYFSISFSFFSGLSFGSIYPALRRMAQQGLVTMRQERQTRAPDRKVYTITGKGREVFLDALRAPLALDTGKSPFLMRLFFFADLSPEDRVTMLRNHLEAIRQQYRRLDALRPQIEAHADRFQHLCFQFGLRFHKDLAGNIEEILRSLEYDRSADGKRESP